MLCVSCFDFVFGPSVNSLEAEKLTVVRSDLKRGMRSARRAFEFGDDLHGANLRRVAQRARRKRREHQSRVMAGREQSRSCREENLEKAFDGLGFHFKLTANITTASMKKLLVGFASAGFFLANAGAALLFYDGLDYA